MHCFMVACVQTAPSLLRFLVVIHAFFEHQMLSTDTDNLLAKVKKLFTRDR